MQENDEDLKIRKLAVLAPLLAERTRRCVSFPVKLTVDKETVRLMKASGET